jgi:hypothetical protein
MAKGICRLWVSFSLLELHHRRHFFGHLHTFPSSSVIPTYPSCTYCLLLADATVDDINVVSIDMTVLTPEGMVLAGREEGSEI